MKKGHFLVLLAMLALTAIVSACAGVEAPGASASKPTIKLIANTWPASELNVTVAADLLKKELGYPVEIVKLDEQAQWDALAGGQADASLEVWPSGHGERIAQYIDQQKVVENGGKLGVVGKIAWYTPKYVVDKQPDLATWEGFKSPEVAKEFATAETGDKGTFFAGPLGWTQYDQEIMDQLGINFQVINTASEEALLAQMSSDYERQQPILFYFYKPHAIFAKYDLAEVKLPDCASPEEYATKVADKKVDCAYPDDQLMKIFSTKLKDKAPDAYNLLKNFNYTTDDQIQMLAMLGEDKTVEEAAQAWIDAHPDVWKKWLGK